MSEEWLDAPDGDGWWWMNETAIPDDVLIVSIRAGQVFYGGRGGASTYDPELFRTCKWQRVKAHGLLPKPRLPKSKQVTLAATVGPSNMYPGEWDAWFLANGRYIGSSSRHGSQESAANSARAEGIEPTLEKVDK